MPNDSEASAGARNPHDAGNPEHAPAMTGGGPVPGADLVGTILAERYRILEKLGDGAMGNVYLGEHLKIGRRDAIKVLRSAIAGDPEAERRFLRGARILSTIHHPNVCTIYDFGEAAAGLQFLAMEFVPGETLKELLDREGTLTVPRAIEIARQTAAALQAAHDAGIVHRDLKPGNIMISPGRGGSDAIKVVDFDIAKGSGEGKESEVTRHGFVVGTPEYMSPEQLMGETLDGRSDIYSLALVLFRSLAGALPFTGETTQDLMIRRLTEQPRRLDEARPGTAFPEPLQQALDRALQRKAADRQPNAEAFAREIGAISTTRSGIQPPASAMASGTVRPPELPPTQVAPAAGSGAATARAAPSPRAGPGSRTKPWIPISALGGGILILAAILLMRGGQGGAPRPDPGTAGGDVDPPPAASAQVGIDPASTGNRTDRRETEPSPPTGGTHAAAPGDGATAGMATPGRDTPPANPTPQGAPGENTPSPTGTGTGTAADKETGAPRLRIALADANDILWRQFERIGTPDPPRAALTAAIDTAERVWELEGADRKDRAFAAYILANALVPLGDLANGRLWAERAVDLCPDECHGYRELLAYYRSRSP